MSLFPFYNSEKNHCSLLVVYGSIQTDFVLCRIPDDALKLNLKKTLPSNLCFCTLIRPLLGLSSGTPFNNDGTC